MSHDDDWTAAAANRMIRETLLGRLAWCRGRKPPMPAYVSSESYGPAADRRPGGVVITISLWYGEPVDPSATVIDITSDFTPEFESCCRLEYELGRAQHEYEAIARGERQIMAPPEEPVGRFAQGSGEIPVEGTRQAVAVLTDGDYHVFRFEFSGAHVTVVGRYDITGLLCFERITDLTPYLPAAPDREELRRYLRERRGDIPE